MGFAGACRMGTDHVAASPVVSSVIMTRVAAHSRLERAPVLQTNDTTLLVLWRSCRRFAAVSGSFGHAWHGGG